ncbi:MAG: hypothetical protein ABFC67_10500 [Mizugakiibacter sp.]|uniref:hypothetical protein n=1 Tax=Mizugakiibacter sp. TaxID=1972610 RepID=UPI0031C7B5CF|nr:hypothetical protein [Xanthomonadaceae bacterium]
MSPRSLVRAAPLAVAAFVAFAHAAPPGPLPPPAGTQPSPAIQRAQKAALLRDTMQKDALQRSYDRAAKQSIREQTADPATARQVDAADKAEQRAYEDRQRKRQQDLLQLESGAPAPAGSAGDGGPL